MTTTLWFMKRHWTQENGNLKTRAELGKPDTNQAEQWLTLDLFLYRGHVWEVLLNGQVVKLNGKSAKGKKLEPCGWGSCFTCPHKDCILGAGK